MAARVPSCLCIRFPYLILIETIRSVLLVSGALYLLVGHVAILPEGGCATSGAHDGSELNRKPVFGVSRLLIMRYTGGCFWEYCLSSCQRVTIIERRRDTRALCG